MSVPIQLQSINNFSSSNRINTLNQIRTNEQKIAIIDEKIALKEKLITANEKFLKDTKELFDNNEKLIAKKTEIINKDEQLIANNNERIGLLRDSKELLISSVEDTKKLIGLLNILVDLVRAGKVNLYKDQNGKLCAKELNSQQPHVKIAPKLDLFDIGTLNVLNGTVPQAQTLLAIPSAKLDLYEIGTLNALNGFEGKAKTTQLASIPQAYLPGTARNIKTNAAAPVHLPIMTSSNQVQITSVQKNIDRNIEFTKPIIESKLKKYPSLNFDKVKLKVSELISSKYSNIDLSKNQTRLNLFQLKLDNIFSLLLK